MKKIVVKERGQNVLVLGVSKSEIKNLRNGQAIYIGNEPSKDVMLMTETDKIAMTQAAREAIFQMIAEGKRDVPDLGVPPPNVEATSLQALEFLHLTEYQVAAWCPTPDGTGPAEQVHLTFQIDGLPKPLQFRFKTPRELDRMVTLILEYRAKVWPGESKILES